MSNGKYLVSFAAFLAVCAGGLFLWNSTADRLKTHPWSWGILGFMALVYLAGHFFLLGAANDKNPNVFVRRFMGLTTLRLFLFLIVIVTYAFSHKLEAVVFISHFLVFYLAFTAFEVVSLFSKFRSR